MSPKISIIIPTANRPKLLPRAIDSVLSGLDARDVEVIVVPNGPDESWHDALFPYCNNPSIRVISIKESNGNIARNAGLAEARGEFVRFLDDDDYLIPEGAIKQYELIQTSGVDVVSGSVQLVDVGGHCYDIWQQPDMEDFCVAVVGPWRVCLPVAHVYRRSILDHARWNPETSVRQDVEWLFDLCADREVRWKKTDDVVGVWQHHWGQRVTSSKNFKKIRNKMTVPMLIRTYENLKKEGRLNEPRQRAIAIGLWNFIHGAFFLEPGFWGQIARLAQQIDPAARPTQAFYNFPVVCHLTPLMIQWVMLPKRWTFHQIRQLFRRVQIRISW
jgi:glycosyltransferase involved in cell wall biosynthesis